MIILPSYDATGKLNYFTARNFDKTSTLKYKNPDVSRNVIPFELFINWNTSIILCEGMFDAIAIKRNVIPLLGKNIQSTLMLKLVTSAVKKIYVALDRDALREALQFCEQLINEGKEVYLVDLDGKDPSELGFRHFTELIQNTYPLTFSSLLEKKIISIMIEKNVNINKKHVKRILEADVDSKRVNILDSRFYSRNGNYYPSVTNILQFMPKNKYFEN